MTFLRLLSQEGYQNFTYTCMNSVAWYDTKNNNHNLSVKLLGENEVEIGSENTAQRPNVLFDGCKVCQTRSDISVSD
jgi:collagen type V/XI/XXIV/XXVII, alpha